jgi:hypothetical protein
MPIYELRGREEICVCKGEGLTKRSKKSVGYNSLIVIRRRSKGIISNYRIFKNLFRGKAG